MYSKVNPWWSLHKNWKFSIYDFFSKCDQICSFLRIWSHLLNKSLIENFIFCAVIQLIFGRNYLFQYKKSKMEVLNFREWCLKFFETEPWNCILTHILEKEKKIKIKINKNVNKYSWFVCAINDLSTWIWASRKSSHRRILVKRYEKS